jgi:hypothetical protein
MELEKKHGAWSPLGTLGQGCLLGNKEPAMKLDEAAVTLNEEFNGDVKSVSVN